jgi:hypothetical protein
MDQQSRGQKNGVGGGDSVLPTQQTVEAIARAASQYVHKALGRGEEVLRPQLRAALPLRWIA